MTSRSSDHVEAQECREQAKRCLRLADETSDPAIKASLLRSAEGWKRLAQRAIRKRKPVSCRCAHREAVQHYLSGSVVSVNCAEPIPQNPERVNDS